jgi:hypothetical protein
MAKKTALLLLFVVAKFALQFLLCHTGYNLHRDEYLHLDQAHHPAWGYLSVPPVTSWFGYIIYLLGNGVFWVRFFPALFGALTIIIVWHSVKALKGGLFAMALACTGILFSALLRINMLFQPNSFDVLAWTFICYALIKYIQTKQPKWLYFLAVGVGVGFLNKYNILFLLIGLLPGLLLTPQRKIFTNKHLYLSALVALIIVLPNVWWQYSNSFPVLRHMKELAETQLDHVNRGDFIKEQLLFFIGSVYVLIAGLVALAFYEPLKKYRAFLYSLCIILVLFIYLRAKGYYAIGLYPVYFAFGAVYLEHVLVNGWKKYLRPVVIIIPMLIFIPIVKIAFPIYSPAEIGTVAAIYKERGLTSWEDGKEHSLPQDFADMLGWKAIAQQTEAAYNSVSGSGYTVVLCDNYGQAGAINYYAKDKHINAVTLSADYIDWINLDKKVVNLILVQEGDDDDPKRNREKPMFESVYYYGGLNNPLARENGTKIYVLKNAVTDINAILKEEIEENRW